jgi:hypothetical protein
VDKGIPLKICERKVLHPLPNVQKERVKEKREKVTTNWEVLGRVQILLLFLGRGIKMEDTTKIYECSKCDNWFKGHNILSMCELTGLVNTGIEVTKLICRYCAEKNKKYKLFI